MARQNPSTTRPGRDVLQARADATGEFFGDIKPERPSPLVPLYPDAYWHWQFAQGPPQGDDDG